LRTSGAGEPWAQVGDWFRQICRTVWHKAHRPLCAACCLLLAVSDRPVHAQSFGPPVPTELILVLLDREGNVRFTLSGFYTHWENPFRVSVAGYHPRTEEYVTREVRIVADTPSSPLFEGKYVLSRRWTVGFWYNPIRGERLQQSVRVAPGTIPTVLNLERDVDLADVHLNYSGPHGLSAQLGYYRERGTIRDLDSPPALGGDYTLNSWNIWLTQRLDLVVPDRLISDRLDARVVPFLSVGYHLSSDLEYAKSILTGVAITFRERISLSTSVWWFDLSHTATRVTAGLVIHY
jgi:hypothetical protein